MKPTAEPSDADRGAERAADRERLLADIFEHAIELQGEALHRYIEEVCGQNESLRQELLELFRHDRREATPLDAPLGDSLAPAAIRPAFSRAQAGQMVGTYRILEFIAEGGTGAVYLAEQENPRRRVALKIMRRGLLSPSALRRFEHESRVLAFLDHPGIARIIEAGTTDVDERPTPYFALEYVDGVHLLDSVERRRLSRPVRIALFLQICDAVEHAHQKGIIHRDLKPANILIDAAGRAKILDFGIARIASSELDVTNVQTIDGQIIGTIPYMSPEQAAGSPDLLDIRSDIYSLGVLLFEMLTGQLPYPLRDCSTVAALEIVREREATPISDIDAACRGDLATIVAKALAKERQRRYPSVSELAADLRRYLRHEPISARPASAVYLLQKYARRHRAAIGGLAAALLAIVIGAGAALYFGFERNVESKRRQAEAEKFRAMYEFLGSLFISASPDYGGPDVKVVDVLADAATRLRLEFAERPELRAPLLDSIAQSYNTLGLAKTALPLFQETYAYYLETEGERSPETIRHASAVVDALAGAHEYRAAKELGRKNLDIASQALEPHAAELVLARSGLGRILVYSFDAREREEGVRLLREALARRLEESGRHDRNTIILLLDLAPHLPVVAEQLSLFREAIQRLEESQTKDHPLLLRARGSYAMSLMQIEGHDEAEAILVDVCAIYDERDDSITGDRVGAVHQLGNLLALKKRYDEAAPRYRQMSSLAGRLYGVESPMAADAYGALGWCMTFLKEFEGAEAELGRALGIQRAQLGAAHPRTQLTVQRMVRLYKAWERPDKAEEMRGLLDEKLASPATQPAAAN